MHAFRRTNRKRICTGLRTAAQKYRTLIPVPKGVWGKEIGATKGATPLLRRDMGVPLKDLGGDLGDANLLT